MSDGNSCEMRRKAVYFRRRQLVNMWGFCGTTSDQVLLPQSYREGVECPILHVRLASGIR